MKSLVCVCPNFVDGTSLYRGIGPLSRLKKDHNFHLILSTVLDWSIIDQSDGLFIQRPALPQHVQMIEVAKINNYPVWVDYDDDLLNVPMENPTIDTYGRTDIKSNILRCINLATVVTVSTETLRLSLMSAMGKENLKCPDIVVIPNAFDERKFVRSNHFGERSKTVVWRGTHTHIKDILDYAEPISQLMNEFKDWRWTFFGLYPYMIQNLPTERVNYYQLTDPIRYMRILENLAPSLMVVPLSDNSFNRAKSNIAWLEGSFAGASVMCPDFEEWRNPGARLYSDSDNFYEVFKEMLTANDDYRTDLNSASWEYIQNKLTLKTVNEIRFDILKKYFNF